ncbi:MAG: YidC/Oxa1 family membrane protein insertase [Clostridia bacterium]|nr:YidC/Oxa1 family membrane protein insertase [Clostridia bacterium]
MTDFFNGILYTIYSVVRSYGWTVVIFTILVKLLLTPFDLKSRKSMRRMEKFQPKLNELQQKYANDKEKLQKKQAELYKKEGINPLGSCLPMLLTFPVIFIMFGAMRGMANRELAQSLLTIQHAIEGLTDPEAIRAALPPISELAEPFLWIKNIWVADSPFTSMLPNAASALNALGKSIAGVVDEEGMTALKVFIDSDVYQSIVLPHFGAMPMAGAENISLILFSVTLFRNPNGFLILPLLSFITQMLSTSLTPQPAAQQTGKDGQPAPGGGNLMKWGMPLFMVWIVITSNSAFAIYFVASNVVMLAQQLLFKKYFEFQDARALAVKEVNRL